MFLGSLLSFCFFLPYFLSDSCFLPSFPFLAFFLPSFPFLAFFFVFFFFYFFFFFFFFFFFLDASLHLYMRLCPSVGPSVRNAFFQNLLNALYMIGNNRELNEYRHRALGRSRINPISKIICPISEKNLMDTSLFRLELVK